MLLRIHRGFITLAMAVVPVAAGLYDQARAEIAVARADAGTLRVLILTGGVGQDWQATTPVLKRILTASGRFDVHVCESPAGIALESLAEYDVLVDHSGAPAPGSDADKAIAAFVDSGKGLVVTQRGMVPLTEMGGGDRSKQPASENAASLIPSCWPAILVDDAASTAEFWNVKLTRPDHPIARGMPGEATIADKPYRASAVRPQAEVIAHARAHGDSQSDFAGGEKLGLLAFPYGKGRVFGSALGHDAAAMQESSFVVSFARGTEWAATGQVTLPANLSLDRRNVDAVKALLITGGHDHETTFYDLFDGYKDLAPLPVAASTTAFQNDLREKYDVIIMYDFSRDLDEKGKKNLRAFVESGKGIVVLHHALLNYQEWPWWSEEVVGGRYRLKSEGGAPSSTVENGQHMLVTPEGNHPVTAGIERFHIVDETYKRMYFAPNIRPLLTTDNPNSDRSLAWIGPHATARVVAIQLGHGPSAFGHPVYRALVHNAILWSAGRTK